ncbi:MAG: tRNA (adenosine(37)-N6)-threonylcarbamoyltransferase complex dimerization subunit type 1 TsaB [Streptococcaceae bacterium]|nr:tRNA (adenosine(37)-N6)-threonylcarbamoyltransferase complex dimerization subunit type 1 TsaB [Streptococcaceae bacterium]
MKILALDTSNKTLAIALYDETGIVAQKQLNIKTNHSLTLMPAIDELMKDVKWSPHDLTRIVCAYGPGSYTGIRIAVTTAKMLASTLNIELVGISSLKAIAANIPNFEGLLVPIFNARRQNVFAGGYKWENGKLINVLGDCHQSIEVLIDSIKNDQAMVVGDVADFSDILNEHGILMNKTAAWNIPNGATLAELGANEEIVEDIHAFLPVYLKKVEAEEKWLEKQDEKFKEDTDYVEKI